MLILSSVSWAATVSIEVESRYGFDHRYLTLRHVPSTVAHAAALKTASDNESISIEEVLRIMADSDEEDEEEEPDWRIAESGPPPKNWYIGNGIAQRMCGIV